MIYQVRSIPGTISLVRRTCMPPLLDPCLTAAAVVLPGTLHAGFITRSRASRLY